MQIKNQSRPTNSPNYITRTIRPYPRSNHPAVNQIQRKLSRPIQKLLPFPFFPPPLSWILAHREFGKQDAEKSSKILDPDDISSLERQLDSFCARNPLTEEFPVTANSCPQNPSCSWLERCVFEASRSMEIYICVYPCVCVYVCVCVYNSRRVSTLWNFLFLFVRRIFVRFLEREEMCKQGCHLCHREIWYSIEITIYLILYFYFFFNL